MQLPITTATRDRLRSFGIPGMSDEEILGRIMDEVDRFRFAAAVHREAEAEKNWVNLEDFDWGA